MRVVSDRWNAVLHTGTHTIPAHRSGVMFFCRLEIELAGNRFTVSQPATNGMCGKRIRQFRLSTLPHCVERLLPRFQPGFGNDTVELCTHVLGGIPVAGNDKPIFGIECFFQERAKFTENRDDSFAVSGMVRRLNRGDADRVCLPVNIGPPECQRLGWCPESAEATQGHDQPPLSIRARVNNLGCIVGGDEVETLDIATDKIAIQLAIDSWESYDWHIPYWSIVLLLTLLSAYLLLWQPRKRTGPDHA